MVDPEEVVIQGEAFASTKTCIWCHIMLLRMGGHGAYAWQMMIVEQS